MKTLLSTLTLAVSMNTIAGLPNMGEFKGKPGIQGFPGFNPDFNRVANVYNCVDKEDGAFSVYFATTSKVGHVNMTIVNGTETLSAAVNDGEADVTTEGEPVIAGVPGPIFPSMITYLDLTTSALGQQATMTVINPMIADIPSTVYALIAPGVRLNNDLEPVVFETLLIEGRNGGFLAPGYPLQSITATRNLECTASISVF